MTLNSSGPISLGGSTAGQSVNLELGLSATAQISFNDAAVRTLTGTSSGTSLVMPTNFYGKSSTVISISNDSVSVDTVYESDFDYNIANYGIKSNGKIYAIGNSSTSGLFYGTTHDTNWVTPTTAASGYEVRATLVSGNTPIGPALNTWLACTSDRIWYLDLTGFGQYSCTLTIDIRDTATSTIRDTATITLFVKIGV